MASSHKKRTGLRAALIVLLCLILVCAVAAAVLYSFVSRRIKAFQSGASFALDYTITSTEAEPPALYALLDKFGGTTGSLTGQYTPRAVQLALYPTGTSTVNDAPLTRMYISEEETLYDAGQLYNKLRSTVVAEYPLASLLLPGWSLGSYISQDQLATLLGVDPAATGLQQVNDFQLDLKQLKTVQPANAKEGYLYLQLPNLAAGEDAPQLILGIEKQGLLKTLSPKVHILLDGKASHIIEGDYYALQPYDIVFLRPALLHKTEYPVGAPRKRLIINFAIPADTPCLGGMLRQALAPFDAEVPIYRLGDAERASAFGYLNDIFTLGKQPRTPLTELAIHSKFVEFLCAVAQACPRNTYVPQEFDDSITHKIYSITSYIHSNYAQELSLDYISKKFFISPYYLSHQFKSVTGFTLINYIQMTRVRNAQQLLLYTDMKIADITAHCGFTSFSQFNRVFNKFCHTSPSQFRLNGSAGITPANNYIQLPAESREA